VDRQEALKIAKKQIGAELRLLDSSQAESPLNPDKTRTKLDSNRPIFLK